MTNLNKILASFSLAAIFVATASQGLEPLAALILIIIAIIALIKVTVYNK